MDTFLPFSKSEKRKPYFFCRFLFLKILMLGVLFAGNNFLANAQCDQSYELVYTNPACGLNDGVLEIFPDPAGPVYFYQLLTPSGAVFTNATFADPAVFDNLVPGMYTLTATDIQNPTCPSYSEDFTLINDDTDCTPPCTAEFVITSATCGEGNGAVTVQTGLDIFYSYAFTGPNGYTANSASMGADVTIQNLLPGDYEVTIMSFVVGADCSETQTFTIPNDDSNCVECDVEVVYNNPKCGNNDGTIMAIPPLPGEYQYLYQLMDANGTLIGTNASFYEESFDELAPGLYYLYFTIIGTDCSLQIPVELINDDTDCTPPCMAEFTASSSTCGNNNASLDIAVMSDGTLYTVAVTGPSGYSANFSTMGMPLMLGSLMAGDYEVTIMSNAIGADCTETYQVTIEDNSAGCLPDVCEVDVVYHNPTCGNNDGTIMVTPPIEGEYQYAYELLDMEGNLLKINASFFGQLFDELLPGMYNVKATLIGSDCVIETPVELINDESDCCGSGFVAGSISTQSNLHICTIGDAVTDTVVVDRSFDAFGGQFAYFVTNSNGSNILMGPVFDNRLTFEGAMPEVCRIYGVAYCGDLIYDETAGIESVAGTDTFALTNWLPVHVYDCSTEPSPQSCGVPTNIGSISTNANRTYCLENGSETIGPFPMEIENSTFQNVVYVVTNEERSMVVAGPYTSHNFMISADPYTNYRIMGIVYDNVMPTIAAGKSLAEITSPECYDYTNTVKIHAFNCDNGTQLCDYVRAGTLSTNSLLEFCTTGDNQINQVVVETTEPRATHDAFFLYDTNGIIVAGPIENNVFTFEGFNYEGDLIIAQVVWEGLIQIPIGQPVSSILSSKCHNFSNGIQVTLNNCNDLSVCETLENGEITTASSTVVCAGTGTHLVEVEARQYAGASYAFIVTNGDGSQIVQGPLPSQGDILFDLAQPGHYRIRGVAYEGSLTVPIGQPISALSSTMCYQYTFGIDVHILDEAGCEARLASVEANVDTYTISNQETTTLDLTANDKNPCEATPIIEEAPIHGTIIANENGTIDYIPETGFAGTVEFIYLLCCDDVCKNQIVRLHIENKEINLFDLLETPNVITPNFDGINDGFTVKGLTNQLADYTVCLNIYDRYGNTLYTDQSFTESNYWNGQAYNVDLPAGTYFYLLNIEERPEMTKSGFIELRR